MISKAKIRLIRSLEQKKIRDRYGLFIAEGDKIAREILDSSLTVACVLARTTWLQQIPNQILTRAEEIIEINDRELQQISFLKTPHQAMVLVRIPQYSLDMEDMTGGLSLYLDQVQDPGNLGTIIRLADWFGMNSVLCGDGCADPYNPKTVQATMGAIIRVKTYMTDETFFQKLSNFPVYGTFLNGEGIYNAPLSKKAVIVFGNESKGISDEVAQYINKRLTIPSFQPLSESLNVATAAAIVCYEFRRA